MYTAQLLADAEYRTQLPEDILIRALCYGAPPVFRSDSGEHRVFPEIVIVQNDKDGIISASSKTVIDLFNKTVAIDAADLNQDVMVKMIMEKVPGDDADEDEDHPEQSESISSWQDFKTIVSNSLDKVRENIQVDPEEWERVSEAVSTRVCDNHQNLSLLGHTVLQMRNVEGQVRIRKFSGLDATNVLSGDIRLSKLMFDHHMPWGYTHLFNIPDTEMPPDISVLNCLV